MSKLSEALAIVAEAKQASVWGQSGDSLEVVTTFYESDGKEAGTIVRNFVADQPKADDVAEQTEGA